MKASLKIENPKELEATIAITMTLEEWQSLRAVVSDEHLYTPVGKLRIAIDDLVRQAAKTFYPSAPEMV